MSKPGPLQMVDLQEEVNQLKEQLKVRDDELQRYSSMGQQDLEQRLADSEDHSKSLQEQLEQIQAEHSNAERSFRAELEAAKHAAASGRADPEVKQENESLQKRLKAQQEIIDDVRKQGQLYLEEMRAMADSGSGNFEREDKLQADVQRLEEQLREWKAKYVRAKNPTKERSCKLFGSQYI